MDTRICKIYNARTFTVSYGRFDENISVIIIFHSRLLAIEVFCVSSEAAGPPQIDRHSEVLRFPWRRRMFSGSECLECGYLVPDPLCTPNRISHIEWKLVHSNGTDLEWANGSIIKRLSILRGSWLLDAIRKTSQMKMVTTEDLTLNAS